MAFAAALLWTIHPLQTESVTYVVQRVEAMVGLFYLLTLYCFIRGATGGRPRLWYALAVTACLLGMATKEVMATAPLMVLLYDRVFLAGSFRQTLKRRWPVHAALAATWLPLGALVLSTGSRHGSAGFDLLVPWWRYLLTQPYYVTRYLYLAVWPGPLVLDYGEYLARGLRQIAPYAALVLALLAGVALLWRRSPKLAFAGVWFFVVLAPTSSIIPVATQTGAEHRVYLPLAGLIVLAVAAAWLLWRRAVARWSALGGRPRWAVPLAVLAAVAVPLAARTVSRNRDYHSERVIWRSVLEHRPDNARAHIITGRFMLLDGHLDEAVRHQRRAIELSPRSGSAWMQLGIALLRQDKVDEAVLALRRSAALQPDLHSAYGELGMGLRRQGRADEAVAAFRQAVRLRPDVAFSHYQLGMALLEAGREDEAIAALDEAVRRGGNFPEALNNLAWLLATQDGLPADAARAVELAEQARRLGAPDDAGYLDTLAAAYASAGRYEEAVRTAEQAVELARAARRPGQAATIEGRLDLYRAGQPFRRDKR